MQIFDIEIWGEHADEFMALSCDKKKDWIKKHSNQQNDDLIDDFIKSVNRGNDEECQGCKEAKKQADAKTNQPNTTKPAVKKTPETKKSEDE